MNKESIHIRQPKTDSNCSGNLISLWFDWDVFLQFYLKPSLQVPFPVKLWAVRNDLWEQVHIMKSDTDGFVAV